LSENPLQQAGNCAEHGCGQATQQGNENAGYIKAEKLKAADSSGGENSQRNSRAELQECCDLHGLTVFRKEGLGCPRRFKR